MRGGELQYRSTGRDKSDVNRRLRRDDRRSGRLEGLKMGSEQPGAACHRNSARRGHRPPGVNSSSSPAQAALSSSVFLLYLASLRLPIPVSHVFLHWDTHPVN